MNTKTFALAVAALLVLPGAALAQQERREAERRSERAREELEKARRAREGLAYAVFSDDADRPRIGITTGSSGLRDTLGLLVTDVTPEGPAAKAGIAEGDRIQSVNGVNLRLSREDAEAGDMEGVPARRLIRTLGKAKIGDEVELRVYSDGSTKTVKVKTVSVEDLQPARTRLARFEDEDRAAIGIGMGWSGSRRDTLGVFVASVAEDSPTDKAGLMEGDRIQSINGVDLRVPGVDAGDWASSSARMRRLTRELEKLKPGDDVELRVYSGGSSKTVRLKAVKASEIERQTGFFFGDMPGAMAFPRMLREPFVFPRTPNSFQYRIGPEAGMLKRKLDQALPKAAPVLLQKMRPVVTI